MLRYTVILPTYRRGVQMLRSLKSVCAQTVKPNEIIVVNDSPDVELDLDQIFETSRDISLRIINTVGSVGGAAARNHGIDCISDSTDAVAFIDDDDEWLPEKMEQQIGLLERKNVIAVCCGYFLSYDSRRVPFIKSGEYCKKFRYYGNFYGGFSCIVVKVSPFSGIPKLDGCLQSCQDWDYILRLMEKGELEYCREALVIYSLHSGIRISTSHHRVIQGLEKIYARYQTCMNSSEAAYIEARISFSKALLCDRLITRSSWLFRGFLRSCLVWKEPGLAIRLALRNFAVAALGINNVERSVAVLRGIVFR